MTANDNLLPYIKDNHENRRLGTLAVFVDDGVDSDEALLAIPVNLSVLLALNQGLATVGFTGSTGKKWEKHDILSWYWCSTADCIDQENPNLDLFDYHQTSKFYHARHNFNQPGEGHGGTSGGTTLPSQHESIDTEEWKIENSRSASGFVHELADGAELSVPPNTSS
jgi:hypothetical protein